MRWQSNKQFTEKDSGIGVLFDDYSLDALQANEIVDVVSLRQDRFSATTKYQEAIKEFKEIWAKLQEMLPEKKREFIKLDDAVSNLETVCFTAGYQDGMADLMTAMIFNKAELTNVARIDWAANQPSAL